MPYADSEGLRIHYRVEGEGQPLMIHHGFGVGLESVYDVVSLVETLRTDYQLILIDARGHGASDKPHDPDAYGMELRVADVVAVLDELQISKTHFCGYSMGGTVGFGIAKYAPERLLSLIIGGEGAHEAASEEPSSWSEKAIELLKQGMETFVSAAGELFGGTSPEFEAKLMNNDAQAFIAQLSPRDEPNIVDILPTIAVPCLVFAGEKDDVHASAKRASELIPDATFVSLPGLDHVGAGYRGDLILPYITKFLATVGEG
jgi:pimeloyl-ACP methyl ester carboxylesterase